MRIRIVDAFFNGCLGLIFHGERDHLSPHLTLRWNHKHPCSAATTPPQVPTRPAEGLLHFADNCSAPEGLWGIIHIKGGLAATDGRCKLHLLELERLVDRLLGQELNSQGQEATVHAGRCPSRQGANRSRHTPQILLRKTFLLGDSLRKTRKDVRD